MWEVRVIGIEDALKQLEGRAGICEVEQTAGRAGYECGLGIWHAYLGIHMDVVRGRQIWALVKQREVFLRTISVPGTELEAFRTFEKQNKLGPREV